MRYTPIHTRKELIARERLVASLKKKLRAPLILKGDVADRRKEILDEHIVEALWHLQRAIRACDSGDRLTYLQSVKKMMIGGFDE